MAEFGKTKQSRRKRDRVAALGGPMLKKSRTAMSFRVKSTELTTAISDLPHAEIVSLRTDFRVPETAVEDSIIGPELTVSEDIKEEFWLTTILRGLDVIEIGCDVGRRAAYLSQVTNRIVCTDPEPKRRVIAQQTISLNQIANIVVVEDLQPEELSLGDVLLLNSRRPISQKHIDAIADRPTHMIVVLGPLSKELAKNILGAGYAHCSEFSRGAVFRVEAA